MSDPAPDRPRLTRIQIDEIRALGVAERFRQMRAMALADLAKEFGNDKLDVLSDAVEALYALGWQDALLFFDVRGEATWPEGSPFWDGDSIRSPQ